MLPCPPAATLPLPLLMLLLLLLHLAPWGQPCRLLRALPRLHWQQWNLKGGRAGGQERSKPAQAHKRTGAQARSPSAALGMFGGTCGGACRVECTA